MRLFKTSLFALSMMAASLSAFAQTADEIVSKHLSAVGGEDSWKKVNSFKMTGAIQSQGMEIPVTITKLNQKGFRLDMTIMGMANYFIITDKEGWSFFPVQGQTKAEAMTPDIIKESQDELDVQGELVDYKAKGSKIEFVGKDDMEGTEVLKVKLTDNKGKEKTIFFDASSYFILKEVKKVKADGKEDEQSVSYSNFKKLPEGIIFPMTIDSPQGPVTFSSVEVNPKLDESIFKPAN